MNIKSTYTIPSTSNIHVGAKSRGGALEIISANNFSMIPNSKTLTNVKLLDVDGEGVSQIDQIVITPCKIYFIETKHVSHILRGNEKDENWELIKPNKGTINIVNPVIQNQRHINAFNSFFLAVDKEPLEVESIICVGDNHYSKAVTDSNKVYTLTGACNKIMEDLKVLPHIYNVDNIDRLIKVLVSSSE